MKKEAMNYRPFVRWWWFGNALTKNEITRELTELQQQGFGGVEIQPIYSAMNKQPLLNYKEISWLSDEWIDLILYTCQKANELGLQTDLTFGSGWPFGGPHITPELASTRISVYSSPLDIGRLELELGDLFIDPSKIMAIIAWNQEKTSDQINPINLKNYMNSADIINWEVPSNTWVMIWFVVELTKQQVKRATIGGEGLVLDHLNNKALMKHADSIIASFKKTNINQLGELFGAFFCDSWEVYGENWTVHFYEKFKQLMGYDLESYLYLLIDQFGNYPDLQPLNSYVNEQNPDLKNRIVYDYKKVHSELILTEFFKSFSEICHNNQVDCRVQPYAAPTDLLRAYGMLDILEIEGFGSHGIGTQYYGNVDPRLASSAAHIYGKNMVSCESFTWLGEHFTVSLSQLKKEVDQIILHGIQRIIYHGCPASPPEAGIPGWVFYASIMANWNNTWWPYIKELNKYIQKTAELAHQGRNIADFAVYLPIHDEWMGKTKILKELRIKLRECGHFTDFDYINDESLLNGKVKNSRLCVGKGNYYALLFWETEYLPLETMHKIEEFHKAGFLVIIIGNKPNQIPGYAHIKQGLIQNIPKIFTECEESKNNIIFIQNMNQLNEKLEERHYIPDLVSSEPIRYLHQKLQELDYYFLVNPTGNQITSKIKVRTSGTGYYYDVLQDEKQYIELSIEEKNGCHISEGTISLAPFESKWLIINQNSKEIPLQPIKKMKLQEIIPITTKWKIKFFDAGNVFPKEEPFKLELFDSDLFDWSTHSVLKKYAGTAVYHTKFSFQQNSNNLNKYILNLGKLHEIAEIKLNNHLVGTLWTGIPEIEITNLLIDGENLLEIHVTNLLINKIIGYEKAGIKWRSDYYFVNIDYKTFDVSNLQPYISGLLGPVIIKELQLEND